VQHDHFEAAIDRVGHIVPLVEPRLPRLRHDRSVCGEHFRTLTPAKETEDHVLPRLDEGCQVA
jgi:hypothetical protein